MPATREPHSAAGEWGSTLAPAEPRRGARARLRRAAGEAPQGGGAEDQAMLSALGRLQRTIDLLMLRMTRLEQEVGTLTDTVLATTVAEVVDGLDAPKPPRRARKVGAETKAPLRSAITKATTATTTTAAATAKPRAKTAAAPSQRASKTTARRGTAAPAHAPVTKGPVAKTPVTETAATTAATKNAGHKAPARKISTASANSPVAIRKPGRKAASTPSATTAQRGEATAKPKGNGTARVTTARPSVRRTGLRTSGPNPERGAPTAAVPGPASVLPGIAATAKAGATVRRSDPADRPTPSRSRAKLRRLTQAVAAHERSDERLAHDRSRIAASALDPVTAEHPVLLASLDIPVSTVSYVAPDVPEVADILSTADRARAARREISSAKSAPE